MVVITGNASREEALQYVELLESKHNRKVAKIHVDLDGEYANVHYAFESVPFERIRRITGYLVGTMDNWNDAKSCEEKDRVKHLDVMGTLEEVAKKKAM